MSRKTTSSHFCKNHPGIRARATCTTCKAHICKECLLVFKGKAYCAMSCAPKELCTSKPLETQSQKKQQLSSKSIITWSACTLALCAIVFAAWTLRELEALQKENDALQTNRSMLLNRLKTDTNIVDDIKTNDTETTELGPLFDERDVQPKKMAAPTKKVVFQPLQPLLQSSYSYDNGPIDKPIVALTFDGGSMANVALDIIDTLRSRDVHSTIFLTGRFIKKFPEIVALLIQDRHEIGNHTLTHPHLTSYEQNRIHSTLKKITPQIIHKELISTDNLFFSITGEHLAALWRAPYGEYNAEICNWALQAGYHHVGWRRGKSWSQNLDSNDWIPDTETPGFKSPDEVLTKILSLAKTKPYGINGGIILMHLGTTRKNREDQVHLRLGTMIDSLRNLGYAIVPVSEMMKHKKDVGTQLIGTDTDTAQNIDTGE